MNDDGDRTVNAYDGYLGGYIHLRPREGWEKAFEVLRDGRKPLPMRLAVIRMVRLYHGWQPKESRENVLRSEAAHDRPGRVGRRGHRGPAPLARCGT